MRPPDHNTSTNKPCGLEAHATDKPCGLEARATDKPMWAGSPRYFFPPHMSTNLPAAPIYFIPDEDHGEFCALPEKARQEVWAWLGHMQEICEAEHGRQKKVIGRIAQEHHLTWNAVRVKYDRWKTDGWRALCNRAKYKGYSALPGEFLDWWAGFLRSFQRGKTRAAIRRLLERLSAWERDGGGPGSMYAIPGYDTGVPHRLRSTRRPAGWSNSTLTKAGLSRAEKAMSHQGPKRYSEFTPPILSTRAGLKCGQLVFFDDQEADLRVNFPGRNVRAMRPLGFAALDWVSGKRLLTVWKPTILRPDGTKEKLSKMDFYWMQLAYLTTIGWRTDTGTVFGQEMGTAASDDWFKKAVAGVTGGKVKFDASEAYGEPAFRGLLYGGAPGGNFRFKAALESGFNLERNEMQHLRGATGRNRDEKPEEGHGLQLYNNYLLKAMERMPEELRGCLEFPVLEWAKWLAFFHHYQEVINSRTDHALLDFEELGFTVQEVWMPGMAMPLVLTPETLAQMGPEQRAVIGALSETDALKPRKMSPNEVWQGGARTGMRRLHGCELPAVMPPETALDLKLHDDFLFRHEDAEMGPGEFCYVGSQVKNTKGQKIRLDRGKVYRCYLNPFAPHVLQVCDLKDGAWIGEAVRWQRINRLDAEELTERMIEVRASVAAERADMERRAQHDVERRVSEYRWNKEVIGGRVKSPQRKAGEAAAVKMEEVLRGGGQGRTSNTEHPTSNIEGNDDEHDDAGVGRFIKFAAGAGNNAGEDNAPGDAGGGIAPAGPESGWGTGPALRESEDESESDDGDDEDGESDLVSRMEAALRGSEE